MRGAIRCVWTCLVRCDLGYYSQAKLQRTQVTAYKYHPQCLLKPTRIDSAGRTSLRSELCTRLLCQLSYRLGTMLCASCSESATTFWKNGTLSLVYYSAW